MGARVRVKASHLGPDWQVGLLNQLQISSDCHRVLLFAPASAGQFRVRATLEPRELTRLQVAVGPDGRVQAYDPAVRADSAVGGQWREVPLRLFRESARRCRATLDSLARGP